MNKILLIFSRFSAALFLLLSQAHSAERVGLEAFSGFQHDAGNLQNIPGVQHKPAMNIMAGAMIKIDAEPLFYQIGFIKSFAARESRIKNSSAGDVTGARLRYMAVPAYMGLLFPISDSAKLWMGTGASLMIARGSVSTESGKVNFHSVISGLGVKAGTQIKVASELRLFFEWEYLYAWTRPLASTDPASGQKDFYADYTGHRQYLGLIYYIY